MGHVNRLVALLIDLLLVTVFAISGRASHSEGLDLAGIARTAWPFLLACLIGWGVVALLKDDGYSWRSALEIWTITWLGGLAIRVASGDTAALAFVILSGIVLGLLLVGWRWLARLLRRKPSATA